MEPQQDIKKDEDYAIRLQTSEEKDINDNGENIPEYIVDLNLSEDEQKDLTEHVFLEFEALKQQREELKLTEMWEERDRQYDGEVKNNRTLTFNLNVPESKIKTDAIVRAINEAFLDSDPMFDISPRPEEGRNDGFQVAEDQSDFLSFAVQEEIKPETALIKIAKSAVTKFVGIGKLKWAYKREKRRREESYVGKNEPVGVNPDGSVILDNEGLKKFLQAYPDGVEKQKGIVKKLLEEKTVDLVVEYLDTIDNSPKLEYIKIENFYVNNSTDYWDGLKDTHLIAERQSYSYWDLMKKEEDGEFINVEKLFDTAEEDNRDVGPSKEYITKEYDVLEVTTYFKPKGDKEDIKIKAWFGEKKKVFLGAIMYQYYGFDTDYLPFYVKVNDDGFYGGAKSVMFDLKDTNIAENALLNLALHGTLIRNTLTPIVREGSEIESMMLDHQWQAGMPLVVDELTDDVNKAMGFVQWPNVDMGSSMVLMEKLKRIGSDVSRVSDLTTGGESALDPSAPASKTIALLQQSGIGIKDYLRTFLPSFNNFASMILQLYYQMSNEDKKYKVIGKAKAVTGDNPFKSFTRDQMIVKTNIESRAAAFAFDKANIKREALAAYQTVMADPYASRQPELQYKALKTLLNTFGDQWKSISDTSLLSPEEFAQQQQQVAVQAIQTLMQAAQKQAETTGVDPEPREVMSRAPDAVTEAQAINYNPALASEEE